MINSIYRRLLWRLKNNNNLKYVIRRLLSLLPPHKRAALIRRVTYPYSQVEMEGSFVFVHIPKTAGKGVVFSLFGQDFLGHNFAINYRNKHPDFFDGAFKFAFVRNPWDRLVSAYFYLKERKAGDVGNEFARRYINQPTFVEFLNDFNRNRKLYMQWTHFIPQVNFVVDEKGAVIVDFVGRFESIGRDFEVVKNKLGIEDAVLESKNKSAHKEYWEYYNKEMVEIVADIYSEDIDMFGYDFPGMKI